MKRTTLLLLLVGGGVALWAWYEFRSGESKVGIGGSAVALFDFSGEEVSKVELKRADGAVVIVKKDGLWRITTPHDWPGSNAALMQMLANADPMTKAQPLPPGEKAPDASVHGLDSPSLELTLTAENGKRSAIVFGKPVGAGDRVYVRRAGQTEILTIEAGLMAGFDYPVQKLRDPGLCRFEVKELEEVIFESPGQKMRVTRRGKGWVVSGVEDDLGEPRPVEEWASLLAGATTSKFEARTKSRAEYGFEPPYASIEVRLKSRTIKVAVGAPIEEGATRRWTDTSDYPDEVGTVLNVDIELAVPKIDTLRAQRVLPWPLADVNSITASGASEYEVRKTAGVWTPIKPAIQTRFQPDRVEFYLRELGAARVLAHLPASDAPAGAVRLLLKWGEGSAVVANTVDLWSDGTDSFVRTEDPVRIVSFQTTLLWDHAAPGALFFRDPLLLGLMPLQVKSIIIEKDGLPWVSAQFEGARSWIETKPRPGKELEGEKMARLNAIWTGMAADTWVREPKDSPVVGLGTPTWLIRIQPNPAMATNAKERVFLVGKPGPRGTLYGMLEGEEGVFLVPPDAAGALLGGVWKE